MLLAVAQQQGFVRRLLQTHLGAYPFDGFGQVIQIVAGFRHHIRHTCTQRLDHAGFVGEAGHEDGGNPHAFRAQAAKEIEAGLRPAELVVEHQQVWRTRGEPLAGRLDTCADRHPAAGAFERLAREPQDAFVVINDQHIRGGRRGHFFGHAESSLARSGVAILSWAAFGAPSHKASVTARPTGGPAAA